MNKDVKHVHESAEIFQHPWTERPLFFNCETLKLQSADPTSPMARRRETEAKNTGRMGPTFKRGARESGLRTWQ